MFFYNTIVYYFKQTSVFSCYKIRTEHTNLMTRVKRLMIMYLVEVCTKYKLS